ncbi:integrase domain-containing protein [Pseudoduganella rivuli]|nr:integrase domain-containing protein [Pseudoduganella rivuli]
MSSNSDWKAQLDTILKRHNGQHAVRAKVVSHSTMEARGKGLFRSFALLRSLGYEPSPYNLRNQHIGALVRYWTAEPPSPSIALSGGRNASLRSAPYSAAYIQQQLSFLRVFAGWIGKPGMVLDAEKYTKNPATVRRTYTVTKDKGWSGNGVDINTTIDAVAKLDEYVAVQLQMMIAFGLRRKEAIMFRPHAAEVPAYALPASCAVLDRYISFLRIKRGTKGGRLRFAAIRTPEQVKALAVARTVARFPHSHLGRPGLTLKQSLDLFSNVVRSAGITKKELGVTPHGLRHEFAGDLYFEIASIPAPVRGGDPCSDPDTLKAAYLEVANQLGHGRRQIVNAYLGSPNTPKQVASDHQETST